jgi:hypothetical protein
MIQANPDLTPNLVKAILQYTAQKYSYDALTQGAGFLNAQGAVNLAKFFRTASDGSRLHVPRAWSKQVIWGNHRLAGGQIRPNANAWKVQTVWGAAMDDEGDNIVWGTLCGDDCDNIVWGTFDVLDEDNIVWGTLFDDGGENIVWGTMLDDDNIVWGTLEDAENIVWGTDCEGADCDNIVWGTSLDCDPLDLTCDNIVWGTAEFAENIVWGTSGDIENIVWGTSSEEDNMTWGNSGEDPPLFDDPDGEPVNFDQTVFDDLFPSEPVVTEPVSGGSDGGSTGETSPIAPITDAVVTGILGGL